MKQKTATLYRTDGTEEEIQPRNGTHFHLEELYHLLKCDMIEVAYCQGKSSNKMLIIDEEGKLKSKELNATASEWYSAPFDIIVGDAILCDADMLR